MVAVCLDQFHWRDAGFKPLIMLVVIVAGIVMCFKTVVFYFKVLFLALLTKFNYIIAHFYNKIKLLLPRPQVSKHP